MVCLFPPCCTREIVGDNGENGSHLNDPHANEFLQVWPLQIVFYNRQGERGFSHSVASDIA